MIKKCMYVLTLTGFFVLLAVVFWPERLEIVGGDEKTTRALLRESGADSVISPSGLSEDENVIVGAVNLFDEQWIHFRIALMICPHDGERINDFFKGIPIDSARYPGYGDSIVGGGNAIRPIPKLRGGYLEESDRMRFSKDLPSPARGMPDCVRKWRHKHICFNRDFPDYIGKEFSLTFMEFRGNSYYLKDVPAGTAYVWFQIPFDGNRVTQMPIVIELNPEMGKVNRLDICIPDSRELFHTL